MIDALTSRPHPLIFLIVLIPLSLLPLIIAYLLTVKNFKEDADPAESAFGLGVGAVFGLIALILGFSFAFAAERFEARRALIVQEAIAVGRVDLQSDFVPKAQQATFRKLVVAYVQARLDSYADLEDIRAEGEAVERAGNIHEKLWRMVSGDAIGDPRNLLYNTLTASVDEMGDIAEAQQAAVNNHVPSAIVGIILFATVAGSVLMGVTFGRVRSPHPVLSSVFCLLCAATVFTIIDLDDGRRGFIRLEVAPLQAALKELRT
jgi:hypothetical protein